MTSPSARRISLANSPGARQGWRVIQDDAPPSSRVDRNEDIVLHEAMLVRAMLTGDVLTLERLLDERLLFTGPTGIVFGKEDDLTVHRSGAQRMTRIEVVSMQIVRHGTVAIVTARTRLAGVFEGKAFEGVYAYSRTWVQQDEGWRVVAGHVAAVTES